MKKNLTWKQLLLVALVCYAVKFLFGGVLPTIFVAVLEIVGLITLIVGIIGGIRAVFKKKVTS